MGSLFHVARQGLFGGTLTPDGSNVVVLLVSDAPSLTANNVAEISDEISGGSYARGTTTLSVIELGGSTQILLDSGPIINRTGQSIAGWIVALDGADDLARIPLVWQEDFSSSDPFVIPTTDALVVMTSPVTAADIPALGSNGDTVQQQLDDLRAAIGTSNELTLDDLAGVDTTGVVAGEIFGYDGSEWSNVDVNGIDGPGWTAGTGLITTSLAFDRVWFRADLLTGIAIADVAPGPVDLGTVVHAHQHASGEVIALVNWAKQDGSASGIALVLIDDALGTITSTPGLVQVTDLTGTLDDTNTDIVLDLGSHSYSLS